MATEKENKNLNPYGGTAYGGYGGGGGAYYPNRSYTPTSPNVAVGGSYQQVREGIVDYTGFQKGFDAGFKITEPEEIEYKSLQELNINSVGGKIDAFTGGHKLEKNNVLDKNMKLKMEEYNALYEIAQKAGNKDEMLRLERIAPQIAKDYKNYENLVNRWDSDMYDTEVSEGINMYGLNKEILESGGENVTISDFIQSQNKYKNDVTLDVVQDEDGGDITVMRFKHHKTGEIMSMDLTSLSPDRLDKLFNLDNNVTDNVRTDFATGITSGYKTPFEEGLQWKIVSGGESVTTLINGVQKTITTTDDTKILTENYTTNRETAAMIGANNAYKNIHQPHIPSAWNKLYKRLISNDDYTKFELDQEWLKQLQSQGFILQNKHRRGGNLVQSVDETVEVNGENITTTTYTLNKDAFRSLKDNGLMQEINEELKLNMLRDEWKNTWLYSNNYDGYRHQENGRAADLNEIAYRESEKIKEQPIVSDDNIVVGFGSGNLEGNEKYYGAALQSIFGAGDGKGGWLKERRVANGMITVDAGLDFMARWAKNKHGNEAQILDAYGVANYIKNYWNYNNLDATVDSSSEKKSKKEVDSDIRIELAKKSIYYYMKPVKDDIGQINPATGFGNINSSDIDAIMMGKWDGKSKVIDVKKLMTAFRNDLKTKDEKDLFESAAGKLGIDLYGYIEPTKKK